MIEVVNYAYQASANDRGFGRAEFNALTFKICAGNLAWHVTIAPNPLSKRNGATKWECLSGWFLLLYCGSLVCGKCNSPAEARLIDDVIIDYIVTDDRQAAIAVGTFYLHVIENGVARSVKIQNVDFINSFIAKNGILVLNGEQTGEDVIVIKEIKELYTLS